MQMQMQMQMQTTLRRALRAAPRAPFVRPTSVTSSIAERSYASPSSARRPATDEQSLSEAEDASEHPGRSDPNMNGNYPDPSLTSALPVKRQFRDPYGDWWDKQERRNYGEPVHEDNDILGIFSPEAYTHFSPGFGAILLGTFVGAVGVLCAVVYQRYPDRASVARTFPDGLEKELGGPKALRARNETEGDVAALDRHTV